MCARLTILGTFMGNLLKLHLLVELQLKGFVFFKKGSLVVKFPVF